MESRMDRYYEKDISEFSRSKKNASLYKEIYDNFDDLEDLPVSNNTNEIDLDNLKSLLSDKTQKVVKIEEDYDVRETDVKSEDRIYDINTLLENAKKENAKIKKEVINDRSIPNYLAELDSDTLTKEIINSYDGEEDDDTPIVREKESLTSSSISISMNTASLSLDILSDLKPSGNTMVTDPIVEESEKEIKEFYSGKFEFNSEDFDTEEEDNDFDDLKGNYTVLKVFLLIVGLSLLVVGVYFVLKMYVLV